MGFVGHLKYPASDEDAVIAEMLEAAGAVFYCKTNVPQTLFVSSSDYVLQRSSSPRKSIMLIRRRFARASTMFLGEP